VIAGVETAPVTGTDMLFVAEVKDVVAINPVEEVVEDPPFFFGVRSNEGEGGRGGRETE